MLISPELLRVTDLSGVPRSESHSFQLAFRLRDTPTKHFKLGVKAATLFGGAL